MDLGEAPDPGADDAAVQLHRAAFRRVWAILESAETTPQDVISIYAATRIAARVGADRAPTKRARLHVRSLLPPAEDPPKGTRAT